MKYVTFLDILLSSLIFCFVIALASQIIWGLTHKKQKRPNIMRLLAGVGVTAIGSSVVFAIFVVIMIPSVYVVGTNDYETKMFISNDWTSQITNKYIDNQSGELLELWAVGYGSGSGMNDYDSISIPAGAFVECNNDLSGYNTEPPTQILSKRSSEVRWYLFSTSYIYANYKKSVFDYSDFDYTKY